MLGTSSGVAVNHSQHALRLVGRSFVGLAVSCALILQLLLAGLAFGGLASAASGDGFVICYGSAGDRTDHPDRKSGNPLHCALLCAQAHGYAAALPPSAPVVHCAQAAAAPELQAAARVVPARFRLAHSSRGPPGSA
jgi:hypothetical protein